VGDIETGVESVPRSQHGRAQHRLTGISYLALLLVRQAQATVCLGVARIQSNCLHRNSDMDMIT
jgi:hypothetical protein